MTAPSPTPSPTPSRASAVLRAPQVGRVLLGSIAGRLPTGSAPLALLLFARSTMPISLAGVLVGAYTAGMAIGQPMLARLADRWRQPPVMWAAAAGSTAGFALIAFVPGVGVAIVAAALAGLGAPPFEACLRVLWKDLVAERLLPAAYTVDVTFQELIFILGPVATVTAVGVGGPRAGLFTAAAIQLIGTLVFTTAPSVRRWRGEAAVRHWAGPLRSGRLRLLLAATVLVGFAVGATTVAVTNYAEVAGKPSAAGWLLAAQAFGSLLGGIGFARRQPKDQQRALPLIVGILAIGYLPLLSVAPLPIMAGCLVLSGLTLPPMLTSVFLSTDQVAPAGTAAEAFAWVATAFSVGSAIGSAIDGTLVGTVHLPVIGFTLAPLAIVIAAVLLWSRRNR
ncbi:MAG TPA: MFS transporter [Pseudonocardiaceae bacterium]|jgi:predicted MFS family arabinose efflux permease|nr:MFS transporter [Pseudonocardiaceae bacterium]